MRGLDYNIPLQGQQVQIQSPMDTMGKLYKFQAMQSEAEERQRQQRLARQAEEEQKVLGEAFNGPLDRGRVREFLQTANMGHLIPKTETMFDGWDKSRAEAQSKAAEAKQKADEAEIKRKQYLATGARDLLADGLDYVEAAAFIDHAAPILGEEAAALRQQIIATRGNPEALKQIVGVWASAAPDQAGYINATTNRADSEATRGGKKAESVQKEVTLASNHLLRAKNQAEYDLLLEYEIPAHLRQHFPREYNAEAIKSAGLTANEKVTAEDRDATRKQQEKRDGMYDRHNRVMEGQAAKALTEHVRQFNKRVETGDIGPSASGGGAGVRGVSATRMSEIEQWVYTQKQGLDKLKGESQIDQGEYDRRMKELDEAYQKQLRPPAFTLGELNTPASPGAPNTLGSLLPGRGTLGGSRLDQGLTMGNLNAPLVPSQAPPTTPKLFTDDEVNKLLGGPRNPGRYELDDGTVWEISRAGAKPRRIS